MTSDPSLTSSQSLTHLRAVASLSVLYRYYCGFCSLERAPALSLPVIFSRTQLITLVGSLLPGLVFFPLGHVNCGPLAHFLYSHPLTISHSSKSGSLNRVLM